MAVRRLDDVTQAVKDMDGGLEAMANRLGRETGPVAPGVPDILDRGFLSDELREHMPPLEFRDPVPPVVFSDCQEPKIFADTGEPVPVAQYWGSAESGVTGLDGYFFPRSQYPGTAPHVTFAEGGGHD